LGEELLPRGVERVGRLLAHHRQEAVAERLEVENEIPRRSLRDRAVDRLLRAVVGLDLPEHLAPRSEELAVDAALVPADDLAALRHQLAPAGDLLGIARLGVDHLALAGAALAAEGSERIARLDTAAAARGRLRLHALAGEQRQAEDRKSDVEGQQVRH